MVLLAGYAGWRMTRRASVPVDATGAFATIAPTSTAVAVEAVIEAVTEAAPDAPAPEPPRMTPTA